MIFISYRQSDTNDPVARLDDSLTEEFGHDAVFRDKTRLHGGQEWPKEIEQNAKSRRVMLAVIGQTWESATCHDGPFAGRPRLLDPDDWVRREIAIALDSGNAVIPLLVNGASMPKREFLLSIGLERLRVKQGIPLRTDDYRTDLLRLIRAIHTQCPDLPPKHAQRTSVSEFTKLANRLRRLVERRPQPDPVSATREINSICTQAVRLYQSRANDGVIGFDTSIVQIVPSGNQLKDDDEYCRYWYLTNPSIVKTLANRYSHRLPGNIAVETRRTVAIDVIEPTTSGMGRDFNEYRREQVKVEFPRVSWPHRAENYATVMELLAELDANGG